MLLPLGLTVGVYGVLVAGLIARGYGRWARRWWRR